MIYLTDIFPGVPLFGIFWGGCDSQGISTHGPKVRLRYIFAADCGHLQMVTLLLEPWSWLVFSRRHVIMYYTVAHSTELVYMFLSVVCVYNIYIYIYIYNMYIIYIYIIL